MPSSLHPRVHSAMKTLTIGLGLLTLSLAAYAIAGYEDVTARLLPANIRRVTVPWKTIDPADIEAGITAVPDTNIILHIPASIISINRRTLLGYTGDRVRYWGYCFPKNPETAAARTAGRFPGTLFLSERERQVRLEEEQARLRATFSPYRNLTEERLNETETVRGSIRHQLERFEGGTSCYLMTAAPLPVGLDADDDKLNSMVEKEIGSNPNMKDTDGDGLDDGLEFLRLGTSSVRRDTDGDGLTDSMEDSNMNGRIDHGETDATKWDTDRDGLCDGLCIVNQGGTRVFSAPDDFEQESGVQELRGEDKNLNGIVDEGEYDPRNPDTNGNGVTDEQEYFNCRLQNKDKKDAC